MNRAGLEFVQRQGGQGVGIQVIRVLLFLLLLVVSGCGLKAEKAIPPEKAIPEALERSAPGVSWKILAKAESVSHGIDQGLAVIYAFGHQPRYAWLATDAHGWDNTVLHPREDGIALNMIPGHGESLGYIGGVALDSRIAEVEFAVPWGQIKGTVHEGAVLVTVAIPQEGRPSSFGTPVPFKALDESGHVLVEGTVPYPKPESSP